MRNHPLYREKYCMQGSLWKIWSAKEHNFNVDEKQNMKLHRLPKNYLAVIAKNQTRRCKIGLF